MFLRKYILLPDNRGEYKIFSLEAVINKNILDLNNFNDRSTTCRYEISEKTLWERLIIIIIN